MALGKIKSVPYGFWAIKQNRIDAMNMYLNSFPRKREEDLIKYIRSASILVTRYSAIFVAYYRCSIEEMLREVRPDLVQYYLKSKNKPAGYYNNIENCIKETINMAVALNKKVEELTIKDFKDNRIATILSYKNLKELKRIIKNKEER